MLNMIIDWVKRHPKKSAAAAIGTLTAVFSFLEQTGWGVLTPEQHKALLELLGKLLTIM